MLPETRQLLIDMAHHAAKIVGYTSKLTQADYEANDFVTDAVQWNYTVIGEALSKARQIEPALTDQISDSRRIIQFRNQLVHGYGTIRNSITWKVTQDHLPLLITELERLLARPD